MFVGTQNSCVPTASSSARDRGEARQRQIFSGYLKRTSSSSHDRVNRQKSDRRGIDAGGDDRRRTSWTVTDNTGEVNVGRSPHTPAKSFPHFKLNELSTSQQSKTAMRSSHRFLASLGGTLDP